MPTFNFVTPETTLNITINNRKYPVIKAGQGIPCLFICLGTPSFRTISKNFIKNFTVYSSDVYWITENHLEHSELVTIDTIIDDIKAFADALKLKKYILFAHSAYGIIALKFAKKYPDAAAGIMMIGTPVNFNPTVIETNNMIFNQQADEDRKILDNVRRAQFAKENLSTLTPEALWLRSYVFRDAPRYWHIPDFDCTELWEGVHLDTLLIRLFDDILPKIDVLQGLASIKTPIFLAAGMSDFDCCPWLWKDIPNLPKNFIIHIFNKSGHWPHYEEADLFDQRVSEWANSLFK